MVGDYSHPLYFILISVKYSSHYQFSTLIHYKFRRYKLAVANSIMIIQKMEIQICTTITLIREQWVVLRNSKWLSVSN